MIKLTNVIRKSNPVKGIGMCTL